MSGTRNVLVVGGGVAGLTLATCLCRDGHRAEIVENEPRWNILGVGISLTGHALRALATIGLLDRCMEASFGFSRILYFDALENPVDAIEMPSLNGPGYPAMVAIGRPALHELLLHAAVEAGVEIRLGRTVAALTETPGRVEVAFSDGSEGGFDLVVGADGFHSSVRRMVFDDAPDARPTGLAVWRAPMARLPEIDCMRMYYGARNKAGLNPVSSHEMFLFLVQSISDTRRPPSAEMPGLLRHQLAGYGGVMEQVRRAITDPDTIDYRPMDALLVPSPWYRGRVLLIGDAAHTTTPHLATGAGIAIEDAVVLAELLTSESSIADCLVRFMERRFERCRLVVETSVTLGEWEKDPAIPAEDHAALMKKTFASLAAPL